MNVWIFHSFIISYLLRGISPERTGLVLFINTNFDKLDQITNLLTNLENVKLKLNSV